MNICLMVTDTVVVRWADYEPYNGKEKQNKNKKLTLDNAKHFSKKWSS